MLVGAGGNAGNQSAIKVIRGLATGEFKVAWSSYKSVMAGQAQVAVLLGAGLGMGEDTLTRTCTHTSHSLEGGYGVMLSSVTNHADAAAIGLSCCSIVVSSVVIGASLPFGLAALGMDPANAGTSIQVVVMDILGVTITCLLCYLLLETPAAPAIPW
ncbi:unnamed protein product [Chrysoparadoxa australica]